MQTEILNLDELDVGAAKSFVFLGVTHEMVPLSVLTYVTQIQALEKLQASEASATESVKFMLQSIRNAFPSLTEEDAGKLDMARIDALMNHIRGQVEEAQDEGNSQ
jgi:hypothetical protein